MAEQPVFWLGGTPGAKKNKGREAPEAERFEPAIREACDACGFELDEYVAAQGGFGGWLAHLVGPSGRLRLFWSGKDNRMKLERALDHGGWQELAVADVEDQGVPVFVESLKTMLQNHGQEA